MKIDELAVEVLARVEEILEVKVKKPQGKEITQSVFDIIADKLTEGETVDIFGFGKFETRERAERKGRNPQTGDEITIAKSVSPAFKPATKLKKRIKDNA